MGDPAALRRPSYSVWVAIGLLLASVGGSIYYIDHMVKAIKATSVMDRVAAETHAGITGCSRSPSAVRRRRSNGGPRAAVAGPRWTRGPAIKAIVNTREARDQRSSPPGVRRGDSRGTRVREPSRWTTSSMLATSSGVRRCRVS
jgi:hypothetical protein